MQDRDKIHEYLMTLHRYLARLSPDEANDVVREIESHIYDALDACNQPNADQDLDNILSGFGDPRALAAEYVDHIIDGAPPPQGFRAIQSVKRGVSMGMYLGTAFFGYLISSALLLGALVKPFLPDNVGIWLGESGESIVVGMLKQPPVDSQELAGWWLIPLFLLLGTTIGYLTNRILTVLKPKLPVPKPQ